jgi:hypothetical protein
MKVHGINLGAENSTNFPFRPPNLSQQKANSSEKGSSLLLSPDQDESHNGVTTISKTTTPSSANPPPLSVPSSASSSTNGASTTDRERDKSFGKMAHYVNELKKELDSASRSRKELLLETQRLRERCIQFEEKLQSERNKNLLLEEQLEKSSKKQKELQSQLEAATVNAQQTQSQSQQGSLPTTASATTASIESQATSLHHHMPSQHAPHPFPPPLPGASISGFLTLGVSAPSIALHSAPPLVSSTSGPIQTSSASSLTLSAHQPSKSSSTSNIPALSPPSYQPLPSAASSHSSFVNLSTSSMAPLSLPLQSPASLPSSSISGNNTPRYGGGGDGSGGVGGGHMSGFQEASHMSTMVPGGGGLDLGFLSSSSGDQIILQGDEFDNFIASRGAPSDEWTDATGAPTSPPAL